MTGRGCIPGEWCDQLKGNLPRQKKPVQPWTGGTPVWVPCFALEACSCVWWRTGVRGEAPASPCLHKGSSTRCSGKRNVIRERGAGGHWTWSGTSAPSGRHCYLWIVHCGHFLLMFLSHARRRWVMSPANPLHWPDGRTESHPFLHVWCNLLATHKTNTFFHFFSARSSNPIISLQFRQNLIYYPTLHWWREQRLWEVMSMVRKPTGTTASLYGSRASKLSRNLHFFFF